LTDTPRWGTYEMAEASLQEIFARFGVPRSIASEHSPFPLSEETGIRISSSNAPGSLRNGCRCFVAKPTRNLPVGLEKSVEHDQACRWVITLREEKRSWRHDSRERCWSIDGQSVYHGVINAGIVDEQQGHGGGQAAAGSKRIRVTMAEALRSSRCEVVETANMPTAAPNALKPRTRRKRAEQDMETGVSLSDVIPPPARSAPHSGGTVPGLLARPRTLHYAQRSHDAER
jgi:hypothetical protein